MFTNMTRYPFPFPNIMTTVQQKSSQYTVRLNLPESKFKSKKINVPLIASWLSTHLGLGGAGEGDGEEREGLGLGEAAENEREEWVYELCDESGFSACKGKVWASVQE